MKPKTKYCPMCDQMLPAKEFARLDLNSPCKRCQSETSRYAGDTAMIGGVPAFVRSQRRPVRTPRPSKNIGD